jgi:hypothetical protein
MLGSHIFRLLDGLRFFKPFPKAMRFFRRAGLAAYPGQNKVLATEIRELERARVRVAHNLSVVQMTIRQSCYS